MHGAYTIEKICETKELIGCMNWLINDGSSGVL